MSREPVIELEDVDFSYSGRAGDEALRGITLAIEAGSHVCILGGNGSGKSTLAQIMNALIAPTRGRARIFGIDPVTEPERLIEIRRQASMVFQHVDDQMVTSIVADDVAFGPENLGVPQPEIVRRVDAALAAVDMTALAQSDPADLSGGQRQRVAIAGALAMRPRVLLLDEPAAMLDASGRAAIQRIVAEQVARGITVVHVTHFMDDALRADRVIVLEGGRIALDGTPRDVFSHRETIRALGLELPFTMQLAERLGGAFPGLPATADADELARALAPRLERGAERSEAAPQTELAAFASAPAAVAFEHVSFSYAEEREARRRPGPLARLRRRAQAGTAPRGPLALRDVSFRLPQGELTALIGRTGSGKSTTVELACALKVPNAGDVRVRGVDTADLDRRASIRSAIGYVGQFPERQLFAETVFEDVAFGPRNLGLTEAEVDRRVRTALAAVGIEPTGELLARSPFALSGGQQRCVAFAGVLAMETPLLVLDEPMAGLDPRGRSRMRRLIRDLKGRGVTILLVTHSMEDVAELAELAVALDHGEVAGVGTPRELFSGDVRRLPGVPAALTFARALETAGAHLDTLPITLDDLVEEVLHGRSR
ncbi:ABC transporter ATP-binding protein [Enorma burkinafasonensis]|uniref:ABC transporter ATP-binding protein n=1 Tax=Enorma burkinafasonensis TaxID=2590867 RepID=UPI00119FAB17|nr:energy-coupling factor transporter ATPase [Enorma burkinafasonensis]